MLDRDVGVLLASLRAPAAVLRNPDLRRLEVSWAAMSFATWAFAIALAVYAFEIGGATAVGVVALVRLLPGALAAPFAGLFGDSYSRRVVLVASAASAAVVLGTATVAAAAGAAPALVYCTAGAFAMVTAAYVPAESALLPLHSRTPQELSAANVVLSAMDNGGFLAAAIGSGLLLALGGPELVFGFSALLAAAATVALVRLTPDARPDYVERPHPARVLRQTLSGASAIAADAGLRLLTTALTVLVFFEGLIDVLVVVLALELLGLGESSVGYLNAAWGVGALVAGVGLAVMLDRGKLALGIGAGSLITGAATVLIAAWPTPTAAYIALATIGVGYTLVEVAGKTFLQRLGSDETLARLFGFLETSRLLAMSLGSIVAPVLIALFGIRGALVAAGVLLPLVAALRWARLRAFETGTPVDQHRYELLRGNTIFQPLPVATLERLCQDLEPFEVEHGAEIITEGSGGDRFYLIDSGEVAVFRGGSLHQLESDGESFGEIALIRDTPRTATVRATRPTTLLTLEREQFINAVTGYPRSRQIAEDVIDARLAGGPMG